MSDCITDFNHLKTMLTCDEWFEQETINQLDTYTKTKRARRASNPQRDDFISDVEFNKALEKRVRLCPNEIHIGDRLMKYTFEHFYNENGVPGGACKQCKKTKQHQEREATQLQKQSLLTGRFKTAQEWEAFNANTYNANAKHRHVPPKEDEFETNGAYLEAIQLENKRRVDGDDTRMSKTHYETTENTKKRKQYADDKDTEEGRLKLKQKQEADQKNKMARKAISTQQGKMWCPHGSHAVDESMMRFCPKNDLGIANFPENRVGQMVRPVCRTHYMDWLMQDRKFKQKYRDDLSLRWRFRLEWFRHNCRRKHKTIALTADEQLQMIRRNCYYCNVPSTDDKMNGIDMLHPMLRDYNSHTCVTCCTHCNMSKGGLKYKEYIEICKNVASFQASGSATANSQFVPYRRCARNKQTGTIKVLYYMQSMCYEKYRYDAKTHRNLKFTITQDDYESIISRGCAYCGLQERRRIGLDQIDAGKGYTVENLNAACVSCNFVKLNYPMDMFLQKCQDVAITH